MKETNKKELAEKLKVAQKLLSELKKANEEYRGSTIFWLVNKIPVLGSYLSRFFWDKTVESIEKEDIVIREKEKEIESFLLLI